MKNDKGKVRWGVIGAGDVVEHKSGMPLNGVSDSRWVGLMRRNQESARRIAARFNVPEIYDDVEDLLANNDINAVYIATPPSSHASLAIRALEAGKNVYLEKPMAMNAAESRRIAQAVEVSGKKLVVAHYRRMVPAFMKVRDLIESGAVGTVLFVRLRFLQPPDSSLIAETELPWRLDPKISGGGLFHDIAPHQIDLCLHWFGKIRSAEGWSRNLRTPLAADDYVTGHISFESGVEFDGLWCFGIDPETPPADECEIYGSKGRLSFPFFGDTIWIQAGTGSEILTYPKQQWIQEPMIARAVGYFLDRWGNPCSALEGVNSMEVIDVFTRTRLMGTPEPD